MEQKSGEQVELLISEVEEGTLQAEGYLPVELETSRGRISLRYYRVPGAGRAAVWVGGVGGDWDSPARDMYPRLCQELMGEEISSLRVRYRHPTDLQESILDVLAGLSYLQYDGIEAAALTGHSFGGAVVIQAAVLFPAVRTVVTLATQSYGAGPVSALGPRCSILLIHGTADRVLPASSSEHVYHLAHEPRRLILYPGAGHLLDEVAEEATQEVRDWVVAELRRAASEPTP